MKHFFSFNILTLKSEPLLLNGTNNKITQNNNGEDGEYFENGFSFLLVACEYVAI